MNVTISPITWNLRSRSLTNADHTLVMGVVNATPDSFSDGGQWAEPGAAIRRGFKLWDDGADLVDVGGESTRPGAELVSVEEELARVVPVVEALASHGITVSIDTSKPEVAAAAVAAGAEIVNDVTGLASTEMVDLCEETGVGVVIMHMQGGPRSMQTDPTYDNVVAEVAGFLRDRTAAAIDERNRGLTDRCRSRTRFWQDVRSQPCLAGGDSRSRKWPAGSHRSVTQELPRNDPRAGRQAVRTARS